VWHRFLIIKLNFDLFSKITNNVIPQNNFQRFSLLTEYPIEKNMINQIVVSSSTQTDSITTMSYRRNEKMIAVRKSKMPKLMFNSAASIGQPFDTHIKIDSPDWLSSFNCLYLRDTNSNANPAAETIKVTPIKGKIVFM
jgi:hypothetical protein